MEFRIADTFTNALAKLTRDEQKAVKTSAFDLQTNPDNPGLQVHRIDQSKDPNFWSCRVNRDIRIIIHKTANSFLLAYVDHHDDAYKWAARRRIEAHPKTGAVQIVEVRELVREIAPRPVQHSLDLGDLREAVRSHAPIVVPAEAFPFASLSKDQLLLVGVPDDWTDDILNASEDRFLDLATHLPGEAAEALLEFVSTGMFKAPSPITAVDPFAHPDAMRRFRVVENVEELEQALSYPWERWIVFLHPSQRRLVDETFSGPVRISGSAGTGKTVVAVHRARRLANANPDTRVLLTTFSEPLAIALEKKLHILAGGQSETVPRIIVTSFFGIASELFQLVHAGKPPVASEEFVRGLLLKVAADSGSKFSDRFLLSEWKHVVDAWQIKSAEGYAEVPRLGRKNRMGSSQRQKLWPIFSNVIDDLKRRGYMTEAAVFHELADHYTARTDKPFSNIIVDEAQDLGVPELKFLKSIAPEAQDNLFFAGDLGQRIFQQPFSWAAVGVDVRGRSETLKVNYRTSHQIREASDGLLPGFILDVDGRSDERTGTVSVFNGPEPQICIANTVEHERDVVGKFVESASASGINPEEIAIFVRTRNELSRARAAVEAVGHTIAELTPRKEGPISAVRTGIMNLAKGLEFKAVAVIACDEDIIPLKSRLEAVADEVELDDVYATERQLLYVACTRARDHLLITAVKPGSEFISDLEASKKR